jgi:hypothetical protein
MKTIRHKLALLFGKPAGDLYFYEQRAPQPQNALELFADEWSSTLPTEAGFKGGSSGLFDDERIRWADDKLGGFAGRRVLELGPLEAGHTYMMHKLGTAHVTAVEAHTRAYLRCLIVKETFDLSRVRFLLGDFVRYLQDQEQDYDIIMASGVLYHMRNPVQLIELIARRTDRLFLWTHYFDDRLVARHHPLSGIFSSSEVVTVGGFEHELHRYSYRLSRRRPSFCGGNSGYANWMRREQILDALRHFGFSDIEIGFDHPEHENGPAFAVAARKG